MKMSKVVIMICLVGFIATSCISGHHEQNWHPRTGKKMKKGHNNK
jgi:hypothetical protein